MKFSEFEYTRPDIKIIEEEFQDTMCTEKWSSLEKPSSVIDVLGSHQWDQQKEKNLQEKGMTKALLVPTITIDIFSQTAHLSL